MTTSRNTCNPTWVGLTSIWPWRYLTQLKRPNQSKSKRYIWTVTNTTFSWLNSCLPLRVARLPQRPRQPPPLQWCPNRLCSSTYRLCSKKFLQFSYRSQTYQGLTMATLAVEAINITDWLLQAAFRLSNQSEPWHHLHPTLLLTHRSRSLWGTTRRSHLTIIGRGDNMRDQWSTKHH